MMILTLTKGNRQQNGQDNLTQIKNTERDKMFA